MTAKRLPRRVLVVVVAAIVVAAGAMVGARGGTEGATAALGREPATVTVRIEHSRFSPDHLVVHRGTRVQFVVDNRDPINHELIVGGPALHARHRTGTEPVHPAVPGEVSVGPGEQAVTTFRFTSRGEVLFACHLPATSTTG